MRLAPIALLAVAACSGASTPTTALDTSGFTPIAGNFTGPITASGTGYSFTGNSNVTITRGADSLLSGSATINGTIVVAGFSVPVSAGGTFSGYMTTGDSPSVGLTIVSSNCTTHPINLSGKYVSATRKLTLNGPFDVLDPNSCTVLFTLPANFTLTR